MNTSTRFFRNKEQAWKFAKEIGEKANFRVLDYGKHRKSFWVKYTKEDACAFKEW